MEGENETRRVASQVKRAATAGVRLFSTLVEIPSPLPPVDAVYDNLDARLQALLDAEPKGYLMPRLMFVPAPGWLKSYPNEVSQYAGGKSGDPSIASDRFWKDVEFALESIVEHIKRMPYGNRVIGYHLERGEWFNPADNGYDRSYANREAFRDWLRAKYKQSSLALRASWFDGDVQFHTVDIPEMPDPRSEMAFFDPRKQRRWIDFLEYSSDITADRLIALSRAVKRATDDQALVSVCYGYTFEFEHTYSGHLALDRILQTPSIDLICGPPSYKDRQPGQAGSFPSPVDSIALHGKLWISEDDTKTHLAPADPSGDDFNPHLANRWDTEQVHLRAIGKAMAHQTGIAWMDLWGEGWLDGDDIWNRVGWFTAKYREYLKSRKAESPEVVVLVDERSLLHVQKGSGFLKRILQSQREAIQRAGASVGFYLQSDLASSAFPTDAKLYVFLNPYRLPAEQREAIKEKLQNGGKTLVWMYAAGVCDERGNPDESAHELVGIALRQQSFNAEVGSRISDSRHAITNRIAEREFGARERINPSYYVHDDEPGLTVLAEFAQSGLASIALREFNGWRSVFIGEPAITTDLIRGLCKYAGVHLYTTYGDDYVTVGHGWLTLHAVREGNRTLLLPAGTALYDLTESKVIADSVTEHKLFAKARSTRTFFVAPLEEMRALGLPGAEKPKVRRRAAAAEEPAPDEAPAAAAGPGAQDVADQHEAEPSEPSDMSEPADDSDKGDDRSRRRRRRGGRGRGRRVAGSTAGPPEGA
jgi:hypothetical protein